MLLRSYKKLFNMKFAVLKIPPVKFYVRFENRAPQVGLFIVKFEYLVFGRKFVATLN